MALSGEAGVVPLGKKSGNAHHLRPLLIPPGPVLLSRQLGAEDDGAHDEDGGQRGQTGDDDEAVLHHAVGGAALDLCARRSLRDVLRCGRPRWRRLSLGIWKLLGVGGDQDCCGSGGVRGLT